MIGSEYEPFLYKEGISAGDVEISEEMFIITAETAENYKRDHSDPPVLTSIEISPRSVQLKSGEAQSFTARALISAVMITSWIRSPGLPPVAPSERAAIFRLAMMKAVSQ